MANSGKEELRKKLALVVRSIQWSYAIFWSITSTQPSVLKWVDGYYNGDIKTRKTVQASDFSPDESSLQRSDQLRELYDSLLAEESNPQARRPSASLSPEDLTDTEWYYLVCMSFVFNLGQCLPGKTLANGQPMWLCDAHRADSKVFSRSLLAKSASIQTVICFPFSGGVIELGVTETVLEDPGLIQHIQTSFLEIQNPYFSSTSMPMSIDAKDGESLIQAHLDHEILHTNFNEIIGCEETNLCYQTMESFLIDGLNEGASPVQIQDFHDSLSSNESQNLEDIENLSSIHIGDKENEMNCDETRLTSSSPSQVDQVHYQSVVSTVLKTSDKLIMGPYIRECGKESSFVGWKKGDFVGINILPSGSSQRLLKKVLFEVAQMHKEDNEKTNRQQLNENDSNHVLAERRRREKISERFSALESLVPSTSKVDKVSILDSTIKYIKELEKRVGDLNTIETRSRTRRSQDRAEMSSDNYGSEKNITNNRKKILKKKRKASETGELEHEISNHNVNINVNGKDVLIEIKCPYREGLLLEIIDKISHLDLDSYSVQSNNIEGMLTMTIKSKMQFQDSTIAATGIIKQAIQRVIQKYEI